jgi:hypothetical protein
MPDNICARVGHKIGICIFILFCPILCPIVTFITRNDEKDNPPTQQSTPPPSASPGPSIEEIYGQDKSGNPLPVYNIAPQNIISTDEPQQI